jgi:hypothetical protein
MAANDATVLERYVRFLGPITDRIPAKRPDAVTKARIRRAIQAAFAAFHRRVSTTCE